VVEFERVYVDASVILGLTLGEPQALRVKWNSAISSELLSVEIFRTVDRLQLTRLTVPEAARFRKVADANLAGIELIPLDSTVLRRAAGYFPKPVGTLDAIHLATALRWYESRGDLVLLTHDRQLAVAAQASGLHVYPRLLR
jgi:predicted nucleic acid-binding protein